MRAVWRCVQFDQRRGPAAFPFSQFEDLLEVEPAVLLLHDPDGPPVYLEILENDPAGHEVGELVADLEMRDIGQEVAGRITDHDVIEFECPQEIAGDSRHLEAPAHDSPQLSGNQPAGEQAAGLREEERRRAAEQRGDGSEKNREEQPEDVAPHQNGCPKVKWNVKWLGRSCLKSSCTSTSVPSVRSRYSGPVCRS